MNYNVCLLADGHNQWYLDINDKQLAKIIDAHDYGKAELSLPGLKLMRFNGFEQINIYENSKGWSGEQVSQFLDKDAPPSGLPLTFPKQESLAKIGNEVTDQFLEEGYGWRNGEPMDKVGRKEYLYNVYLNLGVKHKNSPIVIGLTRSEVLELCQGIEQSIASFFVDGRKFDLSDFKTIRIFDSSKSDNPYDKSLFKDEVTKWNRILKNFLTSDALNHFGLDRTHEFKIQISDQKTQKPSNMPKKLFISHSSDDKPFVKEILNLVESAGLPSSQIFCTSFEGYGIELGEDFLGRLREELNADVMVIFVLSHSFYKSPVSLCEMGATWVKASEHIPILIPPFGYEDVKGVFPQSQGMKINEKLKCNSLKTKLEKFFEFTPVNGNVWEQKRDDALRRIEDLLNKNKQPTGKYRVK